MAEEFGPFSLERLLGRGGMAEVFVAQRRGHTDRRVLKRIRPDLADGDEYVRRFVFEAQVASRLKHPNLVRFYEFGKVGDCYYITMEHIRGYSLHRLLEPGFEKRIPPPLPVALHLALGILDGLAAMHSVKDDEGNARPMLHRDITPKNVIVTHHGRPVIIDFGIAKDVFGPALTLPGKVIGTARYMSPEHRKAEFIDASADVFSAGVILFELITARHPWKPLETVKELLRVTFDPPELTQELSAFMPPDVEEVVLKSLACEPADRFKTASEMAEELRRCPSYASVGADVEQLTVDWIRSLNIEPDDVLDDPVLDHGPADEGPDQLVWNAHGEVTTGEHAYAKVSEPPADARVLTIPPLPPPRSAALDTATIDIVALTGRPVWVTALLITAVLVGVVGGLMLLRAHL